MPINKIEVDLRNTYVNDVADVKYSCLEVKLNFNEEIEINMSTYQFQDLKLKVDKLYREMFGTNEAV